MEHKDEIELCPKCGGDHIRMSVPGSEDVDYCDDSFHDIGVERTIEEFEKYKDQQEK